MRSLFIFQIFLILTACTSAPNAQEKELAWEEWKGVKASDIEKHPYFKSLTATKEKHSNGHETWIYKDQSRFQTDAYCQSLGGCINIPTYNCESAFSVKNGVVLGLEQNGSCPGLKVISVQKK